QTQIIETGYQLNILNDETMKLINEGHNPNSYFASALGSQDFHSEYYFIFKVLPALPVFLRKKLTYSVAKKIPYPVKLLFFIYSILYLGYKHRSPRIKVVMIYFTKYMFWVLRAKFFSKKDV
ncbi:MAG: hypothetical protein QMD11_09360, partial [Smithella sp.]|nr:hypothetical protein [Smithella sp.]